MSGYLTERQLDDKVDLPLGLPLTEILPGDSVIIGVVQLNSPNQKLTHRFAQVKIIDRDPASPNTPAKINGAKGYAYAAIFDGSGAEVTGTAVNADAATLVAPSTLPLTGIRTTPITPIVGPSSGSTEYTFKVVNNCSTTKLKLAVSGMWRLDLNV